MNIAIIATGKCRDKNFISIYNEFIKRLQPHFPTKIIEVHAGKGQGEELKSQEAQQQLSKVPDGAWIIALDERGKSPNTLELAEMVRQQRDQGRSEICIIIGGAEGLAEEVRQRADLVLSLSQLTFPHMLVRPIICEQLYRVATVLSGHPYHREG